ncbi:hypothetical protein [Rossellomorea aquimaris]|uniref:hypothetical protein n=1 Tax=Rossellomorea aquimaris TaxID=189382 RepID=UPI000AD8EE6B|nr:hypothetical protein [Rossellomorea aquimaris]
MEKETTSNKTGQKFDSMNSMDQGINLISQIVNNMTGLDKGNDGKENNKEE